jgi:hypothetical protein
MSRTSGSPAVHRCPSFAAHSGVNARADGGAKGGAGSITEPFLIARYEKRINAETQRRREDKEMEFVCSRSGSL